MRTTVTAAALAALILSGCITTDVAVMSSKKYEPVAAENVRVFLYQEDVPEECEEVAMIDAQGNTNSTNQAQMIRAAKREAGKVGGNAVVVDQVKEPSAGAQVAAAVFGFGTSRKGRMVALRCPEEAPAAAPSGN